MMSKEEFIVKIADVLEVSEDALSMDTQFRSLEEWSSISVMLLIAFFDEEFSKEITSADLKKCTTIGDFYNLSQS